MMHTRPSILNSTAGLLLMSLAIATASAHHNSQAEYGPFGSETMYAEGTIVNVRWANPHVSFDIDTTGGDITPGEKWRFESHPINIMVAYGFASEDFHVGDRVRIIGWKSLRGVPMIWPRAVQVNDGPMRSNLRFTDMIDIAKGDFDAMNIVPAATLNGSPPERAGPETVVRLREMGLLDDDGMMIWPPPAR
jgi:hypothetical protein